MKRLFIKAKPLLALFPLSAENNKDVQKIREQLQQATLQRIKQKLRYDTHVVIVEGQRRTLIELEQLNKDLLTELTDIERRIGELNQQLREQIANIEANEKNDNEQ